MFKVHTFSQLLECKFQKAIKIAKNQFWIFETTLTETEYGLQSNLI